MLFYNLKPLILFMIRQSLQTLLLRSSKLLQKHSNITLHGMGAAMHHTLALACALKRWADTHTSHLTPHTSHLTPHTSHLTPHTSHLTPHTSHLTPHISPTSMQGPLLDISVSTCSQIVVDSCEAASPPPPSAAPVLSAPRLTSIVRVHAKVVRSPFVTRFEYYIVKILSQCAHNAP